MTITSPCEKRTFLGLVDRVFPESNQARIIAVEYLDDDPAVLELEIGGGQTWVEYFSDWDRIMVIDYNLFGTSTSRLEAPKLYSSTIINALKRYGNTGAWDLYRKWVYEALDDLDTNPALKSFHTKFALNKRKKEIWNDYAQHFERRFPGKKAC